MVLREQTLHELSDFVASRQVLLAGISALETTGYNAIPDAYQISCRLSW